MSKSNTLVALISYGNPQYTINAINNLCNQTYPVDVILWDNDSDTGTQNQLRAANFPENVTCKFSKENLLWTPAINKVISEYANDYDYVGFMNNDIYLQQRTVEGLIGLLQYQQVGMVGPMGARLGGPSDYIHWKNKAERLGISLDVFHAHPLRGTYLVGACCFLRHNVWKQIGGLDESMPLGADDHDYSIRIRDAGLQLWTDPRYPVNHVGHASGASQNWNKWGKISWDAFNAKWDGYYRTSAEAILCHWDGLYTPGWEIGTGWLSDEDREPIYKWRQELHESNLKIESYQKVFTEAQWNSGY